MRQKAKAILNAVYEASNYMACSEAADHANQAAATLAVGAGMEWMLADFGEVQGYWRKHCYPFDREYCYALAIAVGNTSYIKAFEKSEGRKPFFANKVEPANSRGYLHMVGIRMRERLGIGSQVCLNLPGCYAWAEVTSIDNERVVLTAKKMDGEDGVRRILKLDHDACAKMFPAPKRAKVKAAEETEVQSA